MSDRWVGFKAGGVSEDDDAAVSLFGTDAFISACTRQALDEDCFSNWRESVAGTRPDIP